MGSEMCIRDRGWTGDMHGMARDGVIPGTHLVPRDLHPSQDPQAHFLRSIGDYVQSARYISHSAATASGEDEAADDPGASSSGINREVD